MIVSAYGKVLALGHKFLDGLLDGTIVIQEKVDGSQISFGMLGGELKVRSNGQQIDLDNVPKLFQPAVETIRKIQDQLQPEHTYRAEAICTPRHNVLCYDRIPLGGLIIFDIMGPKDQDYFEPMSVYAAARAVGLEVVPTFYHGTAGYLWTGGLLQYIKTLLEKESCLGGPKIEGVVIKNYGRIGPDGKILRGKFVSPEFKEKHCEASDQTKDKYVVNQIILTHRTEARFSKTVQKLKEKDEWTQTPKDIGAMMRILNEDIEVECKEEIKDALYSHFRKNIIRGISGGFAEWYKNQLALWGTNNE